MTVSAETACQLGYARLRKPLNANSIIQQSVNPTTLHNAIRFAILIYELRLI
nr:MAG TPA: endonuclease [Caudoviricetes sp.]